MGYVQIENYLINPRPSTSLSICFPVIDCLVVVTSFFRASCFFPHCSFLFIPAWLKLLENEGSSTSVCFRV